MLARYLCYLKHYVLNQEYDPGNNIVHKQAKKMAAEVISNIDSSLDEVWGAEVNLCSPGYMLAPQTLLACGRVNQLLWILSKLINPKV